MFYTPTLKKPIVDPMRIEGSGMLVKSDPASLLAAAAAGHKMNNTGQVGGHVDHQTVVTAGQGGGGQMVATQMGSGQMGGQMVNGGSGGGGSQGGSSGRSSPAVDPSPNKLFVGGLSWQTTSERLRDYFGAYGTVKDVLIMKDPITQRSRGFGFITFGEPSSVEKVIAVPNHVLDGKKIDPKHATPKNRGRSNRTKKIFVGGVSQETSAEEVKQYFSQFGKVEEAVMLMDNQTKRHRGFGFVTFECEDVVERVCDIHFHTIKNKKVECKKAQPKEAVQAASLLTKRLMLPAAPPPGITMHGMAGGLMSAQQAAALASAQAAALTSYGKLVGGTTYPPLSAYRYAPYPLPPTAATATHQTQAAAAAAAAAAATSPTAATANHSQQHSLPPPTHQATHGMLTSANGHHHLSAAAAAAAAAAPGTHSHHSIVAAQQQHSQAPVFTSPTTLAPHTFAAAAAAAAAPHAAATAAQLAQSPYQGYSLANVDMSSFQGIDWSAMYGVGMYA